uniref:CD209 antigen-like protein A isoform X2 n=1 Tax=Ictidomys tridecemlineatus TaxID=43179 RepID=UPI001A9F3F1F|nr:CD209 antigen-like protein A isoform X2 [Ictidomys tridecemlineatus]
MSDFKQVRVQQLDPLEEELAASSARGSLSHHALQPPSRAGSSAVSRVPSSQGQKVCQELTQLKAGVDRLCRPCPWDWTFFQGHCYFFSKSQRNWHDSVTACQEEGAQLVVINSAEEQNFLLQISKNKGSTWMGLSDLNEEATWHWVDGSPLSPSLTYWNEGEPNNVGEEDCAEITDSGWNDAKCDAEKFWVCKTSSSSCPNT